MSCKSCDEVQKSMDRVCFVRIENANVMLVGCDKHIQETIKRLKEAMK